MPVTLEIINRPNAHDLADLEKIYAGYLGEGGPLPPVQSLSAWFDAQRDARQMLIGGRFNGHLLAAVWINGDGEMRHLCVRASTRRRGTARQLMQLLQTHAGQLRLEQLRGPDHEQLSALWRQLGFMHKGDHWVWRP